MSKFVVYEEMTVRMSEWEFKGYENGVRHYFDSRRRALDYAEDLMGAGFKYMGSKIESNGREYFIMIYSFFDELN